MKDLHTRSNPDQAGCCRRSDEDGMAMLIALIALAIFSLLSFYMAFAAKTDLRISDNYESRVQAVLAAKAGLAHTRDLIRGLQYDDLFKGPDGTNDGSGSYLAQARTFGFRNPVTWATARALNIVDPSADLSGLPDDGIVSTGKYGSTNGTPLIPLGGIPQTAPNPYGSGVVTTSRYFVRVSDNNGEVSELAGDPANNPFIDGDRIVIARSMGAARTIRESAGGVIRSNSVAVLEARFRLSTTMSLDAPFVIEGNDIQPARNSLFDGNSFDIDGGASNYGIATIDTVPGDGTYPAQVLSSALKKNQEDNIHGLGSDPSIRDITDTIAPGTDKAKLKDPAYLHDFVNRVVPSFADSVHLGNQHWSGGSAPYLGRFDFNRHRNDPWQDPRVIFVNGDLSISGNCSGGGILVVTGRLDGNGSFTWNGLILVIGKGEADLGGWNVGLEGGIFVANVAWDGVQASFGTPKVTIAGNSNIRINSKNIEMGIGLIAPLQLSLREVTSAIDP